MIRLTLVSVLVAFLIGGSINVLRDGSLSSSFSSSAGAVRLLNAAQPAGTATAVEIGQSSELDFFGASVKELTRNLCSAKPLYQPLVYDNCKPGEILNVIPLFGGMTNALKMILLGAILSYEEGRCFYVDESEGHLNPTKNGAQEGFITKYMEPIGLPKDHPYVQQAYAEGRVQVRPWKHYWQGLDKRRVKNKMYNITSLGYGKVEGHQLKQLVLRRMWRLLPEYREATCASLHQYDLGDEFMAFSVRRGDKTLEKFTFTPLSDYIKEAKTHLHQFGGKLPKIFVATDDCRVMIEFREMQPDWIFVSECDKQVYDDGFALSEIKNWSDDHQESHFRKFFVEMYALATSKVFLGVAYTNVTWWVFFMRPFKMNLILLDKRKGTTDYQILNMW